MKKFLPIILVLALAAAVLCFTACGNDTVDDTITSMSNELTSIMDDATTLGDELEEDLTDMSDMLTDESTSENDITDENISGTSDTAEENTSANATN